jgi:ribose transport system substrate-binding protein
VSTSGETAGASTAAAPGVTEAQAAVDAALKPPTAISQTNPLPSPPGANGHIIFLANPLPATTLIGKGIEEATKAIGWDYSQVTYDTANPATLQAGFMTALAKKPTAVVISGISLDLFGKSVISAYEKARVPIVASVVCPAAPRATVVLGPNGCAFEQAGGKLFADWFIADSQGKGKALLADVTAYPSYAAWGKAFRDEVAAKCPDCSVKDLQLTADQVNKGEVVPSVVSGLRADQDIKYAVFDNGEFTKGFSSAVKAAGLSGIVAGGRAVDEGSLAALKKGDPGAWTASSYPLVGYGSVDAALRAAQKADGYEGNAVSPIQLLTKANSADVSSPYNEPASALQEYMKLWQVGS